MSTPVYRSILSSPFGSTYGGQASALTGTVYDSSGTAIPLYDSSGNALGTTVFGHTEIGTGTGNYQATIYLATTAAGIAVYTWTGTPAIVGLGTDVVAPVSLGNIAVSLPVPPPAGYGAQQGQTQAFTTLPAPFNGDARAPLVGYRLAVIPGVTLPVNHTVTGLPAPLASASLTIKARDGDASAVATLAGTLTDPGTLQASGTYTAVVAFKLTAAASIALTPGTTYTVTVIVTTTAAEPYTTAYECTLVALHGGPQG